MPSLPPRHLMIRDISQYLVDTQGMSPVEVFAYNNLEVSHWLNGGLPSDPRQLAAIAQVPIDELGMLQCVIEKFSCVASNGSLYHPKIKELRDGEIAKAQQRSEHARIAITARWNKHHQQQHHSEGESKAKAAIPEYQSSMTQCSMQSSLPGFPSRALPFLEPSKQSTTSARERDNAPPTRWAGGGRHRGVIKAKPRKFDRRALGGGGEDGEAQTGVVSVTVGPQTRGKRVFGGSANGKNGVAAEDGRFGRFEAALFYMWAEVNPRGPRCTWQNPDQAALRAVLREHPDLTLEQFKSCLGNVAASIRAGEQSATAAPRAWIPRIIEYLTCPLDRYRKPLRQGEPRRVAPRQL